MQARSKVVSQSSGWHSGSGGDFSLCDGVDEVAGSIAVLPFEGTCVRRIAVSGLMKPPMYVVYGCLIFCWFSASTCWPPGFYNCLLLGG